MATGKERSLANLKPWPPGQSGNPGGRAKIKEGIRKVTPEWCEELAHYIFYEPEPVFIEWLQINCRTTGEKMFGKLAERVYLTGDPVALKILIELLVGKPKEQVVVSRGPDVETPQLSEMTDEELDKRRELLKNSSD